MRIIGNFDGSGLIDYVSKLSIARKMGTFVTRGAIAPGRMS